MNQIYNIYCDESCHLEHDSQNAMVLGAVWCPLDKTREIARHLRRIKSSHGLSPTFEIKWTKVSPGQIGFYLALMDYFFDESDLHFRALIVPDKTKLQHSMYRQTHDDWYYKMFFSMLKAILSPDDRYRIYIDIKDTHSSQKAAMLHEVLCNSLYDFRREIVERIQPVASDEVEQLQLADLLIGAISYINRGLSNSAAKNDLVNHMRQRSGYQLTHTTLLRENKVNLFVWEASERDQ